MLSNKKISTYGTLLLCSALSLFYSACQVTKTYEAPEVDTQALFRLDSLTENDTPREALAWEDFFMDATLKTYIEDALSQNYDYRAALEAIEQAESRLAQAKQAWLPRVDATGSVQQQRASPNSRFGQLFQEVLYQYDLSANIAWEIDIWGKIKSQKRLSAAQLQRSQTARQAIRARLIGNVADLYFQLLGADERRKILVETIDLRKKNVQTLQKLKESGQSNQLAVDQAEVQVTQAQTLLVDLDNQRFALENTLSVLLGEVKPEVIRDSLFNSKINPAFTTAIPAEQLRNRPDVRLAELDYLAAFEQRNVAYASLYPSLNITGNVGLQSLEAKDLFSINSFFWTLVGGLTQPVFARRQLKTQVEISESQLRQNRLNFDGTLLNAGMEVSTALRHYATQAQKLELLLTQETRLLRAQKNAEALLRNGYANYLEVLNVQASILNVQLERANTQLEQLRAATRLYRTLGGGA